MKVYSFQKFLFFFNFRFNSFYLKQLTSQSKFSGTRKLTLSVVWDEIRVEMSRFDEVAIPPVPNQKIKKAFQRQ